MRSQSRSEQHLASVQAAVNMRATAPPADTETLPPPHRPTAVCSAARAGTNRLLRRAWRRNRTTHVQGLRERVAAVPRLQYRLVYTSCAAVRTTMCSFAVAVGSSCVRLGPTQPAKQAPQVMYPKVIDAERVLRSWFSKLVYIVSSATAPGAAIVCYYYAANHDVNE